MDVRVAGHQLDTGDSLREHAERRVAEITEKYFSRAVGANVTFGRGPNNDYTCDIIAPVVNGVVLKSSYSGREAEIAFNGAADRIEKQLRRYTNRLKEHKVDEQVQAFVGRIERYKKLRALGSAALMLAYVACGRCDAYAEEHVAIWDVAAGLAIVQAAGVRYTMESAGAGERYHVEASNAALGTV